VLSAFGWGTLGGASFVVGGVLALRRVLAPRATGLILGVGSGALVGAITYELVEEAALLSDGSGRAAVGLALGALVSFRAAVSLSRDDHLRRSLVAPALAAGLDVASEAIVIVGSLLLGHGLSAAAITAVFLCGVPEAIAWTGKLRERGIPDGRILLGWLMLMVLCGLLTALGYGLLEGASDGATALVLAFAGGALLVTVMIELVPGANARAGALAGLATTLGLGLSFGLVEFA
jgi:ZIP family zinc transporter